MVSVYKLLFNKYFFGGLLCIGLVFYFYYLNRTVENLREQNIELQTTISLQNNTIKRLREDFEKVVKARDEFEEEKERLSREKKDLERTLYRENRNKKSLEELALERTTLIQTRINEATKRVFECFEIISRGGDC